MLVAVACKLLRVLYGMLKHNKDFDPDELLRHFDFRDCNKEKFIKEYIGDKKKLAIPKEELEALFKEKYWKSNEKVLKKTNGNLVIAMV